ncbi:hypothetical protein ACTHOQ_08980 [Solibacillus silvestris]|uniref:hypothetical protein n=1 Tax=Solibacillus silvestris TaxID=76853 RepID=UPI003F81EB29
MRRFFFPIIFIGEWILFFYVSLLILILTIINLANVIYVDMSWEEPITIISSTTAFIQLVLLVAGLSIVCFLYIKHFAGEGLYKRVKAAAWGILFSLNLVSCISYLLIWYRHNEFDIYNIELILLLFIILVSVFLMLHIIKKSNE